MKTDLTEIVFILDRSGSMQHLQSDTIGGYNSFLKAQKEAEGEAQVTTILFDDKYEILHNGAAIMDVAPITGKEYFARGMTAMLDAVGKTITDVGIRLNNTPGDEKPAKVIFVITTDGLENASVEFSYDDVKRMITHQQEKYSWEFIFLGANIDAVKAAKEIGIRADRASNYDSDKDGTELMFSTMSQSVGNYRATGIVNKDWDAELKKRQKPEKQ